MRQIVANLYSDRIPTSSLATLLNNGSGVAALQNSCEEAAYSMEVMKSVATEAATCSRYGSILNYVHARYHSLAKVCRSGSRD